MLNSDSDCEVDMLAIKKILGTGVHRLRFNDISVPVSYQRGTNDIMIVIFHGASDQSLRSIPRFQTHLRNLKGCHQISIADPTLEINAGMMSGWYMGGATMPLQQQLPGLLKLIFKLAGTTKRIYLGGSSGGFAALYYSLVDPGSVCVSVNPQTDLGSYPPKLVDGYLKVAWPTVHSIQALSDQLVVNLPKAYSKGFENMVIYLQSVGDIRHYQGQMPIFCEVALKSPEKFILNTGYWGVPRHSNSVPSKIYLPWVKAVVTAPWLNRQAILDKHHILTSNAFPDLEKYTTLSSSLKSASHTQQVLRQADLLRDYHLSQHPES